MVCESLADGGHSLIVMVVRIMFGGSGIPKDPRRFPCLVCCLDGREFVKCANSRQSTREIAFL